MSFELDPEFKRKLARISAPTDVPLTELFPPEFVQSYSSYRDFPELFDKSPIAGVTGGELAGAFQQSSWDEFVRQNTTFTGWAEMKNTAALANVKKRWNS